MASSCVVEVDLVIDGCVRDVVRMNVEYMLQFSEAAVTQLETRANEIAGGRLKCLTYQDDEVDWCTLTRSTLNDALSFAVYNENADVIKLGLHVRMADDSAFQRTPHKKRSRMQQRKLDSKLARDTEIVSCSKKMAPCCSNSDVNTLVDVVGELSAAECQTVLSMLGNSDNEYIRCAVQDTVQHVLKNRVEKRTLSSVINGQHNSLSEVSVVVSDSGQLVYGIEAHEDDKARCDITEKFLKSIDERVSDAFCVGRVVIPVSVDMPVPVCTFVTLSNDGHIKWPSTGILKLVSGNGYGLPDKLLKPLAPGECTELPIELNVPPEPQPGTSRSAWMFVDTATDTPFGPLLIFDVVWAPV